MAADMRNITVKPANYAFELVLHHTVLTWGWHTNPPPGKLTHQLFPFEAASLMSLAISQDIMIGSRIRPNQLKVPTSVSHQPVARSQLLDPLPPTLLGWIEIA